MRHGFALLLLISPAACTHPREESILSWEEYGGVVHDSPYVVRVDRGRGELLYFGVRHFQDPDDPQVEKIRRLWSEFGPTVLLYEGPTHDAPANLRAAIPIEGEGGVVRWLAARDRVPARSFDPTEGEQVASMRKAGYSSEEIVLWYCLRQVIHERGTYSGAALDGRMLKVFDFYRDVPGMESMPVTVEELDMRVRARFPELPSWRTVPDEWRDPAIDLGGWANEFSRRLSAERDRHMLAEIDAALARGERVFAIAGSSHVVMQEPALRGRRR